MLWEYIYGVGMLLEEVQKVRLDNDVNEAKDKRGYYSGIFYRGQTLI